MSDFSTDRIVVARKTYACRAGCGCDIEPGTSHTYFAGVWQGDFYTSREHVECSALCGFAWDDWNYHYPDEWPTFDTILEHECDDLRGFVEKADPPKGSPPWSWLDRFEAS